MLLSQLWFILFTQMLLAVAVFIARNAGGVLYPPLQHRRGALPAVQCPLWHQQKEAGDV